MINERKIILENGKSRWRPGNISPERKATQFKFGESFTDQRPKEYEKKSVRRPGKGRKIFRQNNGRTTIFADKVATRSMWILAVDGRSVPNGWTTKPGICVLFGISWHTYFAMRNRSLRQE